MRAAAFSIALLGATTVASAEPPRPQVQLDLGLAVIGAGFEVPLGRQLAVQAEAFVFGTYFLPWFDVGDNVAGVGGGIRATYFARLDGRGLYFTPFVRAARVTGERDGSDGTGPAVSGGIFAGWAFALTARLDLRVGGGAQYIFVDADPLTASTPFVALDAVLGYRL